MLTFSREAFDEVIFQAYDGHEEEVCGLLAGEFDASASTVDAAYPAENAADRPEIRYYIDPEEQLELIETIEDEGLKVAGFYHSHPAGPPRPSPTDADRATWPELSYVIVALDGYPFLGSWRWRDGTFEPEVVRIGGEAT